MNRSNISSVIPADAVVCHSDLFLHVSRMAVAAGFCRVILITDAVEESFVKMKYPDDQAA